MALANIILAGKEWLWPAVGVLVISAFLLIKSYSRLGVPVPMRFGCAFLKLLGIALFAICLLEPQWTGQRAKPGANYFAILVDNSSSLKVKEANGKARSQQALDLLDPENNQWQSEIGNDFQLRRYTFDSQLRSSHDFSDLDFNGPSSALMTSLKDLKERFKTRPLAGVVVLSDGSATDYTSESLGDLNGLAPVYPALIGSDQDLKDLSIEQVSVSQTAFEDAPVRVTIRLASNGLLGESAHVSLIDKKGETAANQQTPLTADGSAVLRFELAPEKLGISFYQAQVRLADEPKALETDGKSREVTLANNQQIIIVDRGTGAKRILYISGRPNWEYKFLHRALETESQLELTGLIRVAKREAKFEFKGRAGESSNPLFRGFDKVDEETQRYDQPVLVRMNVRDASELRDGFPKKAEDLFQFHAIVLDDLESAFFSRFQMNLIKDFVSIRGGGLLMLGGQQSLAQGRYSGTPIGDVLPLYLDQLPSGQTDEDMRMDLSREGWLLPWARLRDNEPEEIERLTAMPLFGVVNRTTSIKPAATVVSLLQDGVSDSFPGMVMQPFGNGKSAALTVGDLWRWGMHKKEGDKSDLERTWRQTLRWLTADVKHRIHLEANPIPGDANQSVLIRAHLKDKEFSPMDNANVTAEIQPMLFGKTGSTNAAVKLELQPSAEEAGWFESTFVPRSQGGYRASIKATDEDGIEIGSSEIGWASDPAAEEYKDLSPNRSLLESIASSTGGEMVTVSGLNALAGSLPSKKAPVTETFSTPVWHTPYVFLLGLLVLVTEWGWRRYRGLA